MKEWWDDLADRERRLIAGGVAVLALLLGYVVVIEPLHKQIATAQAQRDTQQRLVQKLERISTEAKSLQGDQMSAGALPASMTLQAVIAESAQAASLRERIATMTAEDLDTVKITLQDAPLDATLQWLLTLRQQYGVRVLSLEAEHGGQPGSANLALALGTR